MNACLQKIQTASEWDVGIDRFKNMLQGIASAEQLIQKLGLDDEIILFLQNTNAGKATLLDFGCGSGRDTKYFIDNGYEVDAMDGSKELCKAATKYTGIQVQHMLFEDFNASNAYDGIWACASILHLKKCELPDMIKRLYQALKRNGVIYMSFKYGDFEGVRNGRYFTYLTEESFDMLMKPIHGFMKEKIWITGDVRQDRGTEQWLNIILRKVTTI